MHTTNSTCNFSIATFATLVLGFVMLMPLKASAIPAFSRQIHAGCYTCHFQNLGALNAFGRSFEMNGFRETQKMRKKRLEKERHEKEKKKKQEQMDQ